MDHIELTKELANEGYQQITCCKCGMEDVNCFVEPVHTNMVKHRLCYNCLFWMEMIDKDKTRPEKVVIAEGHHYLIEPDPPAGYRGFTGFGGAKFVIQFKDGRRVESRNVWHQGDIPQHFREHFPDNAEFVEQPQTTNYV